MFGGRLVGCLDLDLELDSDLDTNVDMYCMFVCVVVCLCVKLYLELKRTIYLATLWLTPCSSISLHFSFVFTSNVNEVSTSLAIDR